MKIAILYICTGKYSVFWKEFYSSCEKYFILDAEKHYFVFTDSLELAFEKDNKKVSRIYQDDLGWPNNTLLRFEMFSKIQNPLSQFDYIIFFNADLVCLKTITATEFLPGPTKNLIAVIHPGFFNKSAHRFPLETRRSSTASLDKRLVEHYFAGGLNGGKAVGFLSAINEMKKNTEVDKKNGIVAVWHDESHWNKYLYGRTDVKILDPGYLYPEAGRIPFMKVIMIRDKRKYFNYKEIGKQTKNSTNGALRSLKSRIEKIGFIQRSLIWQLAKIWIGRTKLLMTIYRNEKIGAIKAYLKNDIEFLKIMREINSFKKPDLYDFNGVRLSLLAISADTFMNVIKPSIEDISYEPTSIRNFYSAQKAKYKTLTFLKDNYKNREPDYIGGHLVSHGFTYFYKEIVISNGDTVIDLGAAPGDFCAVCIKNGASKVYAFEPEENCSSNLNKVRELNDDKIEIVRKYCSTATDADNRSTSLDDFVKTNGITKVDFIKADTEGAETSVLLGAKNILKIFKPKLAFCTYHSINDEKTIEKAIIEGNPSYHIYKLSGIIYAH